MQETQVRSLGWEDSLEKEMATHPSILAWRIDRGARQATVHAVSESNMTEATWPTGEGVFPPRLREV